MNEFDTKYNIVNEPTPPETLLRGRYKRSFAYYTIRDRLPVILTQVLDNLSKAKDTIVEEYGEDIREEIKSVLGDLSKLKYELQTDKTLTVFEDNDKDVEFWNTFLNSLTSEDNTYYTTCWLYAETYLYRRIQHIFASTSMMRYYDYFKNQKETALTNCVGAQETILESIKKHDEANDNLSETIKRFLKVNLWGNRCDLSISEGKEIKQTGDMFGAVDTLDQYVLIDNTDQISDLLSKRKGDDNCIVDFVLDNSGYELFTDFLVANFLLEKKLASKIRFHAKRIPWYISDVTPKDFDWTIQFLKNNDSKLLKEFGEKLFDHLSLGRFELCDTDIFWTGPYEYYRMREIKPDLYEKLSQAYLVIFKGDLNYRKLIGDFNWKFTETFETCLRKFLPTNICSLRTIKADIVCGLNEGIADTLSESEPDWMVTGKYGTIQLARQTFV